MAFLSTTTTLQKLLLLLSTFTFIKQTTSIYVTEDWRICIYNVTQQGDKLVATGNVGKSNHGYSVALSGDSNTAIVRYL
jgi:hypothetical protein